jgi:hypothetical protein
VTVRLVYGAGASRGPVPGPAGLSRGWAPGWPGRDADPYQDHLRVSSHGIQWRDDA